VQELLSIGEVAARAGLRTSALRYYEDEGLLQPTARVGGRRQYDRSAIDTLTVIRFCQQLGFTLGEIRELLTPPRGRAQKERWRGFVDAKLAELEAAAERTRTMQAVLRVSRDCDCVDLTECAARCST
jgi:MerR family transcriptional regulator, redox-sensitive transcriptional activator SoxR